jgi:hypothetical protein
MALPWAPSPELALPQWVERSPVERPRVGALGSRHGGSALCHPLMAWLDPARWRVYFPHGV